MADVKQAVDFVLTQEDSALSGAVTCIPGDRGGLTRFGLCAKWHPELVAKGFFDQSKVPGWQALPMAEDAYERGYERELCLGEIGSDAIAKALLSFAVNEGRWLAVKLLQQATGMVGDAIDGMMGPRTVDAVNGANEHELLDTFCGLQAMHYEALGKDPTQTKFLKGWLDRDKQVEALA